MAQGRRARANKTAAAAEAAAATEQATEAQPPHRDLSSRVFPAAPFGWTRYIDPASQRTYLYCDANADWYWEDGVEEPKSSEAVAFSNSRPPAPPIPHCGTSEMESVVTSEVSATIEPSSSEEHAIVEPCYASEDPVVIELASTDPIVRDLIRDEMKLRKKLREITALETAQASGQSLEVAQVTKVSKKLDLLADLSTVREQLLEAKSQFCPAPPSPRKQASEEGTRTKVRKPQQKQKKTEAPAMNPLPQAGRAPMPVHPAVAMATSSSNSASRIAALAPPTTLASNPRVRVAEACSTPTGYRDPQAGLSLADFVAGSAPSRPARPPASVLKSPHPGAPPTMPKSPPQGVGDLVPRSAPSRPAYPSISVAKTPSPATIAVVPKNPPPLPASMQVSATGSGGVRERPKAPPVPSAFAKSQVEDDDAGFVQVGRGRASRNSKAANGHAAVSMHSVGRSPFAPKPQDANCDDDAFW